MHKTYLYLSRMKAGSDARIPVSCHGRIKRNVNRSSSLNSASYSLHSKNPLLVSLGILTSTGDAWQSAEAQLIAPWEELERGAAGQVTRGTAGGSRPSCPTATASPAVSPPPAVGLPHRRHPFQLPPVPSNCTQHTINGKTTERGG